MSDLILPTHLRPIVQSFNETHLSCMAHLGLIETLVAALRAMPEDQFGRADMMPVITPPIGLAIGAMGVLTAMMTLCSAEADMLMQDNPGTFSIDGAVAQSVPLLLWITHGINLTMRAAQAIPPASTICIVALSQNRHTVERVCASVELMIGTLRQRFPGSVPLITAPSTTVH